MDHRQPLWQLRRGYIRLKGNPMTDPYASQRPPRGRRVRAADRPEFEPVDVAEIRARFELSQAQFAQLIGISPETLRNWERGRRHPLGPSRALLRIAAAHPNLVAHVLRRARADWSPEEDESWEPLSVVVTRHRARRARRHANLAERAAREALKAAESAAASPDVGAYGDDGFHDADPGARGPGDGGRGDGGRGDGPDDRG